MEAELYETYSFLLKKLGVTEANFGLFHFQRSLLKATVGFFLIQVDLLLPVIKLWTPSFTTRYVMV